MTGLFTSRLGRIFAVLFLVAVLLGVSGCKPQTTSVATNSITVSNSDYFTIAVLPDTQYYSEKYPAIFTQQTQWIADNAQTQHIVFVSQVGDLVEDYNIDLEWKNAQQSMGIIRNAGIPYSVVPVITTSISKLAIPPITTSISLTRISLRITGTAADSIRLKLETRLQTIP